MVQHYDTLNDLDTSLIEVRVFAEMIGDYLQASKDEIELDKLDFLQKHLEMTITNAKEQFSKLFEECKT